METDATGWVAEANTTATRSTTRSYSGAASLQLKATATGAVSAYAANRIAVTAGTEYVAYAYFGLITAAAGRTATVTVSYYSAVTGGTFLGSWTSAPGALPNSVVWAEPPPILVTTAPAGAKYASMRVTVNGLTAAQSVVMDLATFGPAVTIPGNLLPYNVQGVEADTSGWQSVWNCSVDRVSTLSYEGWWALRATATAVDLLRVGTTASVPVAAGVEHVAYAWVYPPVTGELHVQIRWYDAVGTQISTSSQTWTGLAASTWTRCAVIDKAPPGATSARVVLEAVATAAGQSWIFDQVRLSPSPILPGNLLGYNDQSFEVSVSSWKIVSGATSLIRSTPPSTYEGVATLRFVADGTVDAILSMKSAIPVVSRQAYLIAPYIYHPASASSPVVDMLFTWQDAAGATISVTYSRWTLNPLAGWYAPQGSSVAPANAVALTVGLRFIAPDAGAGFHVDNVFVGPGGINVLADPLPGGVGTAITMQGMTTSSYTYWSLSRMGADGTLTPVRGPSGDLTQTVITGDSAVAEDYEAPLGVPVRYLMKLWTGSTYINAASEPLTLPEPDYTSVSIVDPGLPARNATAVVGTLPDWVRAARQGVNPVRGRARPIVITDVRTSRTGTLTLITETQEELESMWWLLETGNTLLIRWPRAWGESDVYVQVGDVSAARLADYAGHQDRAWSVPLTEVDRPIGGATGSASRTWDSVRTGNPDWLGVLTSGATNWLDVYTGVNGG
jgi:hypothetical protein